MKYFLLITFIFYSYTLLAQEQAARSLASIKIEIRKEHGRELLGPNYKKSVVSQLSTRTNLERSIFATIKLNLPKKYKRDAQEIARTIVLESVKHQLDPYFVMAVISGESSFNPEAKGPVGEIGLMQLRSNTGKWMANLEKTSYHGSKTLRDPVANIKLGTAYLAWLRTKFNGHGQLYVAAYNMGPGSVKNALEKNIWPKDYPLHVMKRYIAFYNEL